MSLDSDGKSPDCRIIRRLLISPMGYLHKINKGKKKKKMKKKKKKKNTRVSTASSVNITGKSTNCRIRQYPFYY
jgi:hypothetical protein